jgi:hypothetical protein
LKSQRVMEDLGLPLCRNQCFLCGRRKCISRSQLRISGIPNCLTLSRSWIHNVQCANTDCLLCKATLSCETSKQVSELCTNRAKSKCLTTDSDQNKRKAQHTNLKTIRLNTYVHLLDFVLGTLNGSDDRIVVGVLHPSDEAKLPGSLLRKLQTEERNVMI